MRIYVEDGQVRPVSMVIETPRGPNTVGIRNLNMIEFPIAASVDADEVDNPSVECVEAIVPIEPMIPRTFHCECDVDSVQVLLETQGEPMSARIELLQGPMDNKQVIELTTEDGFDFPFFCRLETPGSINVVRIIINTGPGMLMGASVVPHSRDGQVCFRPRRVGSTASGRRAGGREAAMELQGATAKGSGRAAVRDVRLEGVRWVRREWWWVRPCAPAESEIPEGRAAGRRARCDTG